MQKRLKKFIQRPRRALITLALPIVLAMIVQVAYNIADTAFVGRLGAEAIAALTFAFPIFFILISLNAGIGTGINSRISRLLGAKRKTEAENTAIHGVLLSFVFAVLVYVLGFSFLKPLLTLLGAQDKVFFLTQGYLTIIFFGIFFLFLSGVLASIFYAQGDTKTPTRIQIFALVFNIVFDPIFIYVLGLGVKGAAIATALAFFLGFILLAYYLRKKSYLKLRFCCFKLSGKTIWDIFKVGAPATITMLFMSFYFLFINRLMARFGTPYVAAFGIVSRLDSVAVMPSVAVALALLTLVGMFYGARRFDLLKKTIDFALKLLFLFTAGVSVLLFVFARFALRVFTPDPNLLNLGSPYLKIVVFVYPFMALSMVASRSLQGMGSGLPALTTNFVRVFGVAIPLAYFCVIVLGNDYLSIALAMVLGTFAAALVGLIWLKLRLRKLNNI